MHPKSLKYDKEKTLSVRHDAQLLSDNRIHLGAFAPLSTTFILQSAPEQPQRVIIHHRQKFFDIPVPMIRQIRQPLIVTISTI